MRNIFVATEVSSQYLDGLGQETGHSQVIVCRNALRAFGDDIPTKLLKITPENGK
ncbi:MAG: hypothetical protein U9Q82_09845 [Chloroflexota bacterium]|nr:hypothetical protein [Chloroflexota bacterium]